jgi:hypothetical protein
MENKQGDNITYIKVKPSFKYKLGRNSFKISDPEKIKMLYEVYTALDDTFDKLLPEGEMEGVRQAFEEALEALESLCFAEEQIALLESGDLELSRQEIEKSLIGSLLLKPELFEKVNKILAYYYFESEEATIAFIAIHYLYISQKYIDIPSIIDSLKVIKKKVISFRTKFDLDKAAIEKYLFDAQMNTPSPTYALSYACLLKKLNHRNDS